jgi:hypothetical protein
MAWRLYPLTHIGAKPWLVMGRSGGVWKVPEFRLGDL